MALFTQRVSHVVSYVALRMVAAGLRALPIDIATAIGGGVGRALGPWVNRKRHRLALANLASAFPEKSGAEIRRICSDHWANMGRVLVESTQIDRIVADPSRIGFRNEAVLKRYRGKLGAAVGVGLHMGNWELAVWPFVTEGTEPAALYRTIKNPLIDAYLRRLRTPLYPGGLFRRTKGVQGEDARTLRAVTQHVRDGGRIAFACDQYYKHGIPVRMFGKMTRTQPMAAIIARRLGVRIWMARCLRVGSSSYFEVELKELRVPRTANQADDIRTIMVTMCQQFEDWVRDAPEQWLWSNRKWVVEPEVPQRDQGALAWPEVAIRQQADGGSSSILRSSPQTSG